MPYMQSDGIFKQSIVWYYSLLFINELMHRTRNLEVINKSKYNKQTELVEVFI